MTSGQREARHQRELDRIFQCGWDNASTMPPLSERQVERMAFLIEPAFDKARITTALPQAA